MSEIFGNQCKWCKCTFLKKTGHDILINKNLVLWNMGDI